MLALPGVLTLLSLLAVLLGTQPHNHDPQSRAIVGPVAPAVPELAPNPPTGAGPGLLLASPPPLPYAPLRSARRHRDVKVSPTAPRRPPELSVLGRRQTDGG